MLVEIPYRLAGEEQIVAACVGLATLPGAGDLPTYANVTRISVTPSYIQIFDTRPVVEPLIGLNVEVHCPRSPHVMRSYALLVDLPDRLPAPPAGAAATTEPAAGAAVATPEREATSLRARGLQGESLPQGQTYRVVRGDTLSGIAARIAGRPGTIGETADAIFAANQSAFTRGNPDLIEEGRTLTIPQLSPATVAPAASADVPAPVAAASADAPAPVAAAAAAASATAAAPPTAREPESPAVASAPEPPQSAAAALPATDAPRVPAPEASARAPEPAAPPAPVPAPPRAEVATAPPSSAAASFSVVVIAALLGMVAGILLSAAVVFVRRRRAEAAEESRKVREPPRRRRVELPGRIDVVEGSLTDTHSARQMAAVRAAAAARTAAPPDLEDLARAVDASASVDFDVGAAAATNEATAAAATPAPASDVGREGPADAATARMIHDPAADATVRQRQPIPEPDLAPIDDEQHTLTVVELDMLRNDYEAERTLTQQSSQPLREAIADLAATRAAKTATAETATIKSPQVGDATDTTVDAPTARLRKK